MKYGKKYAESIKSYDKQRAYEAGEAVGIVLENAKAKFDETVELHVRLGIDPRQADQQVPVIVGGGFVPADIAAFPAAVDHHKPLFRIGFCTDRIQNTAAVRRTVAGIYIHMKGRQAERAVIPGSVSQRRHFLTAGRTDKTAVVFGESFCFHIFLTFRIGIV